MSPIYSIGNLGYTQAALRNDGTWFVRSRINGRWGKWVYHGHGRPEHAWYDPRKGKARLPNEKDSICDVLDDHGYGVR